MRAKYADGTDRDVTSLAYYMTNNDVSAAVAQDGVVTAGARGEAFIMARFSTHTVGSQFIVLPKGLKFEFPKVAENNYIDTHVHNKLKKLRIQPSPVCGDEEFLRRVTIDVTGTLPTVEEYQPLHGRQVARQAGEGRRRSSDTQRVRRDLADEVGRAVADPHESEHQHQVDAVVLHVAAEQDRQQRADGRDGAGTAGLARGARSPTRRPTTTRTRPTR